MKWKVGARFHAMHINMNQVRYELVEDAANGADMLLDVVRYGLNSLLVASSKLKFCGLRGLYILVAINDGSRRRPF